MKYIPLGMLLTYLGRCMVQGSTAVDAAILGILTILFAYSQYKNEDKRIAELAIQIAAQSSEIAALKVKDAEVRNHISSMKLGMNMRTSSLNSQKQGT